MDIKMMMTFLRFRKIAENANREQDGRHCQILLQGDARRGLDGEREFGMAVRKSPSSFHMDHFDRVLARAADLHRHILALGGALVAKREHDGPDHRDQENRARKLEVIDIFCVEDRADGRRVRDLLRRERLDRTGGDGEGGRDSDQLGEQDRADQKPKRQITGASLAQLGEVDVEHHHDEQEEHGDRADIDDDQDHGQELSAQQHEKAGGVEEGQGRGKARSARGFAR